MSWSGDCNSCSLYWIFWIEGWQRILVNIANMLFLIMYESLFRWRHHFILGILIHWLKLIILGPYVERRILVAYKSMCVRLLLEAARWLNLLLTRWVNHFNVQNFSVDLRWSKNLLLHSLHFEIPLQMQGQSLDPWR